jgi:hypothetical protein
LTTWLYATEANPAFQTAADRIDNFFRFQKSLVFELITDIGLTLTPQERDRIEFFPTRNLQAFLAFSRGLEEEDNQNFAQAAEYYRQAANEDPAFLQALDRAEAVESFEGMDGSAADVLDFALINTMNSGEPINLLGDRILKLQSEPGLGVDLETDASIRTPATEAAGVLGSGLGDPPPVPRGNER